MSWESPPSFLGFFGEGKNTSLELLRAVLMKSMCFAWCFLSFQFACLKESYSVFVFCLS